MDESALTELPSFDSAQPSVGGPHEKTTPASHSTTIVEDDPPENTSLDQLESSPGVETEGTPVENIESEGVAQEEIWIDANLAPTRQEWREAVREVAERTTESYLAQGTTAPSTRELCDDLPCLLNACIQSLGWSSGAYIEARAIWYNHDDPQSARAYSTLSSTAQSMVTFDEAKDEIGYFADRIFDGVGPYFERGTFNAYPTVYSVPWAMGRPMLPPPHSDAVQRAITLDKWFAKLRRWQGLPPNDWKKVGQAIAAGTGLFFSFSRTPGGLSWGKPLSDWAVAELDRMYTYIRSHQARLMASDHYAEDTAFQWLEKDVDEPFRWKPAVPANDLYRLEETAYSLATQLHTFRDDMYLPLSSEP
ncbi:hypothetical protein RSAG8_09610, partial [Rhizoctonia solani AG-8 WAC10335]